jgi:hypothetical protein
MAKDTQQIRERESNVSSQHCADSLSIWIIIIIALIMNIF